MIAQEINAALHEWYKIAKELYVERNVSFECLGGREFPGSN